MSLARLRKGRLLEPPGGSAGFGITTASSAQCYRGLGFRV